MHETIPFPIMPKLTGLELIRTLMRKKLLENNWTQGKFAAEADVSPGVISKILGEGGYENPRPKTMRGLTKVLKHDVEAELWGVSADVAGDSISTPGAKSPSLEPWWPGQLKLAQMIWAVAILAGVNTNTLRKHIPREFGTLLKDDKPAARPRKKTQKGRQSA